MHSGLTTPGLKTAHCSTAWQILMRKPNEKLGGRGQSRSGQLLSHFYDDFAASRLAIGITWLRAEDP